MYANEFKTKENQKLTATYSLTCNSPKCHLFLLKSPKVALNRLKSRNVLTKFPKVALNRLKSPKITATLGPRVGLKSFL